MKVRYLICFILSCPVFEVCAQDLDLSVPNEIRNELSTEIVSSPNGVPFTFRVAYPKDYDANKKYRLLLGLSGGGQSLPVVDYCYAAWFRSRQFEDYITIMPVNTKSGSLSDFSAQDINDMYGAIQRFFSAKSKGWLLMGTSNGGNAAFNFIAANPGLFSGVIVAPGSLGNQEVTSDWKNLKVLLACGSEDAQDWKDATQRSKETLQGKVRSVATMELEGQGHFISIDYDMEPVFDKYFQ